VVATWPGFDVGVERWERWVMRRPGLDASVERWEEVV
jgi:hypothetical protein